MLNKKIMILAVIMAYCSFVPCVGGPLMDQYQALVKCQGKRYPLDHLVQKDLDVSRAIIDRGRNDDTLKKIKIILKDAERTGLIKQCEKILKGESIVKLDDFIHPVYLQVTACAQNKYGNGNPFEITDHGLWMGSTLALGKFVSPATKKTITITPYSFFNSLLEALENLESKGEVATDKGLSATYSLISKNLSLAIGLCQDQSETQTRRARLGELFKGVSAIIQECINGNYDYDVVNMLIDGLMDLRAKIFPKKNK